MGQTEQPTATSSASNDGGPAFSESYTGADAPHEGVGGGMTLRDYFAGQALAGIMAHDGIKCDPEWQHGVVWYAYSLAAAMLKERNHPTLLELSGRERSSGPS